MLGCLRQCQPTCRLILPALKNYIFYFGFEMEMKSRMPENLPFLMRKKIALLAEKIKRISVAIGFALGLSLVLLGQAWGQSAFTIVPKNSSLAANEIIAGLPRLFTIARTESGAPDTTYTGPKTLSGWYTAAAEHPAGANAPQICSSNGTTCDSSCSFIPSAPGSGSLPALTFDSSGIANFCVRTSDVGKYSVGIGDGSATPGATNPLTVRPFAVVVSGMTGNAASNDPTGTVFTSAGTDFPVTVAGYLWNAAASDGSADSLPLSSVDFATMTSGGIASSYAGEAKFSVANPLPFGGATGSMGNDDINFASSPTTAMLNYSEVGSFTLAAQLFSTGGNLKYLGSSSLNLNDILVFYTKPGSAEQQNQVVGRFKPHHFTLTTPGATLINRGELSCSSPTFTYMGEPIGISFTLSAQNQSGGTTANYSGSYVKFTNGVNWTDVGVSNTMGLGMVATNYAAAGDSCTAIFSNATPSVTSYSCTGGTVVPSVNRTLGPRVTVSLTPAIPAMSWNGGVGTVTANVVFERADKADGGFETLSVGVVPVDSDGVTLLPVDLDMNADAVVGNERKKLGNTKLRYGRLRIANAYGSPLLPLPVDVQAQYWDDSAKAYVSNADDDCTPLPGNFLFAAGQGAAITTTQAVVSSIPATEHLENGTGKGRIVLTKPSPTPAGKGVVKITTDPTKLPYLPGAGTGTFGLYKAGPVIYRRELHY